MEAATIERLAATIVQRGLSGMTEPELLRRFCLDLSAAGVPLCRASLIVDTLHPIHEGRAFRWRSDGVPEEAVVEYGRTDSGDAAETWRRTTFYHLDRTGTTELRRRLQGVAAGVDMGGGEGDFAVFDELRAEGRTDYFACRHLFTGTDTIAGMDCIYSSWLSDQPDGFGDDDLDALRRLIPVLVLAIQSLSLGRVARTLVEVYLGRDAGARVLSGKIQRGVAEKIRAVLWFSDLRGYTAITDRTDPSEILPLLNDYSEAVIGAVHRAGGDVLKLIGDGVLAVFRADDPARACRAALGAEVDLRERLAILAERRTAEGRAVTDVTLGLHLGDVLFGNIGADDRLDFTVVGPAVNEVSRIASLCRSVDRLLLLSAEFVAATPEPERGDLVSVGRYALRGVGRAEDLYTIDPALLSEPLR
ncbi:adenylate cyclase [Aureimonas sp. Leaf454]|uniref:adenylate/guanylate cyclase domain-containing protein n=1 Tax=Aureimonas sp. Leaf454 TaxID=1736381 RepID=UPI0007017603|nr:adenylate/guanylate cyclase domain-containing protein [Aureimonas sp. Leaf454]KQT46376.1 adenylate cyclase [Aureimonas sp. Leaf454]